MNFSKSLQPVTSLNGVGKTTASQLSRLGIENIYDILLHFPRSYLDFSKISTIEDLKVGETATVTGKIKKINFRRFGRRKSLLEVYIFDGTGYLAGIWFNQSYLAKAFKQDQNLTLSGKVEYKYGKLQVNNPIYETDYIKETGTILPLYFLTANLYPKKMRSISRQAFDRLQLSEILPEKILNRYKLLPRQEAFRQIHFPQNKQMLSRARKRLKFEELFLLQAALLNQKKQIKQIKMSQQFKEANSLVKRVTDKLGYELTADQMQSLEEIKADLLKSYPMNRLLQGEVGSGKTIVALLAMLFIVENGFQTALMVPTEILAVQHFLNLKKLLSSIPVKVELLVGGMPDKKKKLTRENISNGNVDIVIGTHALIQKDTNFHKLGLAVVDEQHRFGVAQRAGLTKKPTNVLVMTATPIPRTLAMTCYSDLEISTLRELPGGRKLSKNISTLIVRNDKRNNAYEKIRREVANGRQVYIICPLIEESDLLQVKSVLAEAEYLKNKVFYDLKVAILHSKLTSDEKETVMLAFSRGETDILISTTVIEVGIDVGNATIMLIENAERFGLAQLHQLRGRVGRSSHPSYCIAFANLESNEAKKRMAAFKKLDDGFQLAEADLAIRGEGEITGYRQSGYSDLKLVKLAKDIELIKTIKAAVEEFYTINDISSAIKAEINYRFPRIINN